MVSRLLAWFCATRVGCAWAGHPLKNWLLGMDVVECPCGELRITGPMAASNPTLEENIARRREGGFLL